jgi:predicted NBD/HSP70 family sugar kinase
MPGISSPERRYYVGVDIGGTAAKAAVVEVTEAAPSLLEDSVAEIASEVVRGPRHVIDTVIPAVIDLSLAQVRLPRSDVAAYGVDFPAAISDEGVILSVGNMKHQDWEGFHVQSDLVQTIGRYDPLRPRCVFVDNDAAATMFGVAQQLPASEQRKSIAGLFIGTGLGGAVTIEGENKFRNEGGGSEPGASSVQFDEDLFLFGQPGGSVVRLLEDFVSLVAIERQLEKMHERGAIPAGHPILQVEGSEIKTAWRARAEKLLGYAGKALEQGDMNDFSVRIFEVQRQALGLYLQQVIQFVRPAHVFIGGGVVDSMRVTDQFREWYVDGVKQYAKAFIEQPTRREVGFPQFHTPTVGDAAAPLGAAIMAWRRDSEPAD